MAPLASTLSAVYYIAVKEAEDFRCPTETGGVQRVLRDVGAYIIQTAAASEEGGDVDSGLLGGLARLGLPTVTKDLVQRQRAPRACSRLSFRRELALLISSRLLDERGDHITQLEGGTNLGCRTAPRKLHCPTSENLQTRRVERLLGSRCVAREGGLLVANPAKYNGD